MPEGIGYPPQPHGSPFANFGQSPELMRFLRQMAIENSIREMTADARHATAYGTDIGTNPARMPSLPVPPVQQPPVVPTQAPAVAPVPTAPPPIAAPQNPTPAPGVPTQPQFPLENPGPVPAQPPTGVPVPGPLEPPQPPPFGGAQPLPPEVSPGPAPTPEEKERRVQGWQAFVERVRSDPNLQLAMINFGTRYLQPVPAGQSDVGHFAASLQGSIDYTSALRQQQAGIASTEAGTGLTSAQTVTEGARPAQIEAETNRIGATTERISAMTPKEEAMADAQIEQLKSQLGLTDAQIAAIEAETSLKDDPRFKEATIKLLEARAWHLNNPTAVGSAQLKARMGFIEYMKEYVKRTNDEVIAEPDPEKKEALAIQKANELWYAQGVKSSNVTQVAKAWYSNLKRKWGQNSQGLSWQDYFDKFTGDFLHPGENQIYFVEMQKLMDAETGRTSGSLGTPGDIQGNDPLGLR